MEITIPRVLVRIGAMSALASINFRSGVIAPSIFRPNTVNPRLEFDLQWNLPYQKSDNIGKCYP